MPIVATRLPSLLFILALSQITDPTAIIGTVEPRSNAFPAARRHKAVIGHHSSGAPAVSRQTSVLKPPRWIRRASTSGPFPRIACALLQAGQGTLQASAPTDRAPAPPTAPPSCAASPCPIQLCSLTIASAPVGDHAPEHKPCSPCICAAARHSSCPSTAPPISPACRCRSTSAPWRRKPRALTRPSISSTLSRFASGAVLIFTKKRSE